MAGAWHTRQCRCARGAPMLFEAKPHPLLVPYDGSFDARAAPTAPEKRTKDERWKEQLAREVEALGDGQDRLYAANRWAMLLIFQALDATGKDSMIAHVFKGVNPNGLKVTSFKQPTHLELK